MFSLVHIRRIGCALLGAVAALGLGATAVTGRPARLGLGATAVTGRPARPGFGATATTGRTARPGFGATAATGEAGRPAFRATAGSGPARTPDYVPGEVVVGYEPGPVASIAAAAARRMGVRAAASASPEPGVQVLRLPHGVTVWQAIARLRRQRGVAYAVPNYIAHQAGSFIPNDPGTAHVPGGWQELQWNFLANTGVNAPEAWANLIADHHPGGKGVVIAILDTGIAYRNWHQFKKAPDFGRAHFIAPYDFVADNPFPLDREGHGTFVAGIVAESTNNGIGLTGLAYGATVMPVRVLDADGNGDSATIARGIRYAVVHRARVINLSLEFDITVTAADIPDIISAIRFAHRRGVVVVAASGNDSTQRIAYPARTRDVISVGATTRDGCLAEYSNGGPRLDLVAPGGGVDANLAADPNCHPFRNLPSIHQMTFRDFDSLNPGSNPRRFGFPGSYGTSMAAPEVAAGAVLVIASGVIGRRPSPDRILARLEQTAATLGTSKPNDNYGYGLLDLGAATAPVPATPPAPPAPPPPAPSPALR